MSSCILLFYICLGGTTLLARGAPPPRAKGLAPERTLSGSGQDADALYADRANLASARQAANLWKTAVASNPRNFDAAWKLARADFWLGGHVAEAERRAFYEDGMDAARKAIAIEPNRAEGHFWLGANMGTMAESFGLRAGLKYRGPIKDELETVLKIDPKFQQGSADRALGRWYAKVPGLFGGSNKKAEEHYRAALKLSPISTATHYYFAELLDDMGRKADARAEAQAVLDAPLDPDWTPEDQDFKGKAKALLRKLM
jgi:tetratricopeptide (TPR) repeat protein